jgi:hypothetical protein
VSIIEEAAPADEAKAADTAVRPGAANPNIRSGLGESGAARGSEGPAAGGSLRSQPPPPLLMNPAHSQPPLPTHSVLRLPHAPRLVALPRCGRQRCWGRPTPQRVRESACCWGPAPAPFQPTEAASDTPPCPPPHPRHLVHRRPRGQARQGGLNLRPRHPRVADPHPRPHLPRRCGAAPRRAAPPAAHRRLPSLKPKAAEAGGASPARCSLAPRPSHPLSPRLTPLSPPHPRLSCPQATTSTSTTAPRTWRAPALTTPRRTTPWPRTRRWGGGAGAAGRAGARR